ncbi:Tyrosine-protein phosphatase non-receptor type substrate 1 [Liparis tanakae]|uniref:Tyrosine-protein phosphatase non-receptor type substrate 1 n=1 Tax=Liparis tanakae TaxID=230148 RepID=A0A4Z2IJ59_9TELE|nr:Tyrosine-protein phosphatase non-receptor type substrate 1 [Liparis tanakae]
MAPLSPALTAAPEGLRVRQHPPSLSVMRGETATLSCHFQVESLKYGVQWFRMESGKRPVPKSRRRAVVEENQTSSLVVSEATLEDAGWYYCEVNVLQRDPECGGGTELVVLAPPSAPKIYLQIPPDPQTGHWALFCLTGGFHPNELTLTWTYQSAAGNIDHLSITNCTLPVLNPHGNLSERLADRALLSSDWLVNSMPTSRSRCFQVMDNHSGDVYLFSVVVLPQKDSLAAGITFTCGVQDHPAMTTALTASFTWDASPNELLGHLNVLKMCLLSALTAVFLLEAAVALIPPPVRRPAHVTGRAPVEATPHPSRQTPHRLPHGGGGEVEDERVQTGVEGAAQQGFVPPVGTFPHDVTDHVRQVVGPEAQGEHQQRSQRHADGPQPPAPVDVLQPGQNPDEVDHTSLCTAAAAAADDVLAFGESPWLMKGTMNTMLRWTKQKIQKKTLAATAYTGRLFRVCRMGNATPR